MRVIYGGNKIKMSKECLEVSSEVITGFNFKGNIIEITPFGSGIINDTFLIVTNKEKYILQRINTTIFKDVEKLMNNYCSICNYLKSIVKENGGDIYRETITVVPTKDNKSFLKDSKGECWRAILFIEDTITYDVIESKDDFYKCGKAFGKFQSMLSQYKAHELYESIPNFHNTKERFKSFLEAVQSNKLGRLEFVTNEVSFIINRKNDTDILLDMYERKELPLRVTHNDTKLSNILMDKKTKEGICIIDLDTIMPGLSLYDFGDAIRSGATHTLEDERDLDKVYLDLDLFEAFTKGFLQGTGGSLTVEEVKMLPMGAKVIALEQGIRFLTDYLEGDNYYKTTYKNQNLDRARTQLKLVSDIETKWDKLNEIIYKYL